MASKVRTHITRDAPTESALLPKHLAKQQFGKRLYTLMISRGWHQSELARRASLPRDSVSVYIRGRSFPTTQNLQKLAKALDVAPEELLPNQIESAIDEDMPAFELRASPNQPSVAWLRVNRLVSMEAALQIGEILRNDDALDRSGSGAASTV